MSPVCTILIIALGVLVLTGQALIYRKVKTFDVDEFILGMRVGEKQARRDAATVYEIGRKHGATDVPVGDLTPAERPTVILLPDQGTAWDRHDDPEENR
jgi:hypothetical protein